MEIPERWKHIDILSSTKDILIHSIYILIPSFSLSLSSQISIDIILFVDVQLYYLYTYTQWMVCLCALCRIKYLVVYICWYKNNILYSFSVH